ncbi:hypothetical protein [Actinoplanes couchii]|uniref:Uncharacterized protein n=1 Tax=Actinoplanes couchii TaxID=403638 RepID=A0ABQ3XEX0_9ACTN|nr:hypothetical protein [Actinoplanes couchii]MDR6319906.1 hypothetical protein [Actinoplanes couchii]GID57043.1 hypothetical protein Aco03nite_054470 [Actinoplanes couchii]
MTLHSWDDETLLAEMASALRDSAPLHDRVRDTGLGAWTWRTIDEELELASLTHDSLLAPPVALRSGATSVRRTLVFTGESGTEIQVEQDGAEVVGQVIPPGPGTLIVEGAQGHRAEVAIDDVGCLNFMPPEDQPVRLRVRADGVDMVTEWFRW